MNPRSHLNKCCAQCHLPTVAEEVGCRPDQLYNWLKGKHRIYTKWARRLARYFGCGPELFLDQWYDDPSPIRQRRLKMGLSIDELSAHLGYSSGTIHRWEKNSPPAKIDELYLIVEEKLKC